MRASATRSGCSSTGCSRAASPTEEQLDEIQAEAKAVVDEAVKFAEESPEPELAELYTDVYAYGDSHGDRHRYECSEWIMAPSPLD